MKLRGTKIAQQTLCWGEKAFFSALSTENAPSYRVTDSDNGEEKINV